MTVAADRLEAIEEAIGHRFADRELLRQALIHRSYSAEHPDVGSNERMEFLGDAVLQLVTTEDIYRAYPDMPEGQMAKVRAASVSRTTLAEIARRWGLGDVIALGRGEEATGGREKDSILADAVEAVLAAVYLDGGLDAARAVIGRTWRPIIAERAAHPGRRDYKTRLQELAARLGTRARYRVDESGPDHAKRFTASVEVDGRVVGSGEGRSKKEAEQEAARQGLDRLRREAGEAR